MNKSLVSVGETPFLKLIDDTAPFTLSAQDWTQANLTSREPVLLSDWTSLMPTLWMSSTLTDFLLTLNLVDIPS